MFVNRSAIYEDQVAPASERPRRKNGRTISHLILTAILIAVSNASDRFTNVLKLSACLFNEHNVTIDLIFSYFLHPAENGAIPLWSFFNKYNALNGRNNSTLGYTIYCVRYFLKRCEIYINRVGKLAESLLDRLPVCFIIIECRIAPPSIAHHLLQ